MMAVFSAPTPEEARRFTRTVDSTDAFMATIMSPSAGSRPMNLYSLEMVDRFLEDRTIEDFQAVGLRLDIHYMDFGFLAQWFEEVIGDTELASAIREIHETGEAFGFLVPRVKQVLQERADQLEELLAPVSDTP